MYLFVCLYWGFLLFLNDHLITDGSLITEQKNHPLNTCTDRLPVFNPHMSGGVP